MEAPPFVKKAVNTPKSWPGVFQPFYLAGSSVGRDVSVIAVGRKAVRRRAAAAAVMETTSTEKKGRKGKMHLLQWREMPRHLQFNPYIMTGYRPLLSPWGCINSIFYMHNETVNILTHGKKGTFFI